MTTTKTKISLGHFGDTIKLSLRDWYCWGVGDPAKKTLDWLAAAWYFGPITVWYAENKSIRSLKYYP